MDIAPLGTSTQLPRRLHIQHEAARRVMGTWQEGWLHAAAAAVGEEGAEDEEEVQEQEEQ